MKFLSCLLLMLLSFGTFSQDLSESDQHSVDSISSVIHNPKSHDTIVAMSYLELANYYYITNTDTAIVFCEKAKEYSERSDYLDGRAESYAWLGYLSNKKGNILKALEYNHMSLKLQEETNNVQGMATSYNNIGAIYDSKGDLDKALSYYEKAKPLYLELGNKGGYSTSLNNIGFIYTDQGRVNEGLALLDESLEISYELGDLNMAGVTLTTKGLVLKKMSVKDGVSEFKADSLVEKALICFNESVDIFKANGNRGRLSNSYSNLGFLYLQKGDLKSAERVAKLGYELSNEIQVPINLKNSANLLSIIYEKQNKGMKALEMYKLYTLMKDSLNNDAIHKASVEADTKYNYEKQKALDEADFKNQKLIEQAKHEKVLAIEQEEKEKQIIISIAAAVGLVLVIIFLIFVSNRLQVTKKQKIVIEAQKDEVQQQKEIIEETHKEITDSINYAKRLQNAILPSFDEVNKHVPDNFILFKPKNVVSGDFYWFEHVNDTSFFAVADCTGHGVPGAMVSLVCSNALNKVVNEFGITEPSKILDKTRELVIDAFTKSGDDVKDGMDIALCAFKDNKVHFAGANNPLWIVRKTELLSASEKEAKGTIIDNDIALIEFKSDRQPIGLYEGMKDFTQHQIELYKGDSLYFFTDGFVDQFGGDKGKKFMHKPFKKFLLDLKGKPMSAQKQYVDDTFEQWKGDLEQIDDVCVVGIRV